MIIISIIATLIIVVGGYFLSAGKGMEGAVIYWIVLFVVGIYWLSLIVAGLIALF